MSDLHAKSGPVGTLRSRARASYATSFVPEPANISTFPPIAADCTSFAARSPSENLRCRVTDAGGYPKALAVIDGATADRAAGGALGRSIKICSEGRQNHGKRVYVSGS